MANDSESDARFPFPYASESCDSVYLGAVDFDGPKQVYLACSTHGAGLMEVEVTSGLWAHELLEEMALGALGPALHAHFETKATRSGCVQWKTLYVDLGRGRKGIVKCVGKKIVQQELGVVRKKNASNGPRGGIAKKKKKARIPAGIGVPDVRADIKRQIGRLTRL